MLCKYDVSPPAPSEVGGISGRANFRTSSPSSRPGVGLLVGHQGALCGCTLPSFPECRWKEGQRGRWSQGGPLKGRSRRSPALHPFSLRPCWSQRDWNPKPPLRVGRVSHGEGARVVEGQGGAKKVRSRVRAELCLGRVPGLGLAPDEESRQGTLKAARAGLGLSGDVALSTQAFPGWIISLSPCWLFGVNMLVITGRQRWEEWACQPWGAGLASCPALFPLPATLPSGVDSRALYWAYLLHETLQAPPGLHLGTPCPLPRTCLPAGTNWKLRNQVLPDQQASFHLSPPQHTRLFLVLCLITLDHSQQLRDEAVTPFWPQGPSAVFPPAPSLAFFQPP